MFKRVRVFTGGVLTVAALVSASAAGALTLSKNGVTLQIDRFDRTALASAQGARGDFLAAHTVQNFHAEGFEGYQAWNGSHGTSDPQNTAVGAFSAIGTHGTGGSVVNDGLSTEVRNDNDMRWGRYNADSGILGGKWLDSNDNQGMKWDISGIGEFNSVAFFVIDAADVGGKFKIKVGDTKFTDLAGSKRLKSGNIHFVRIALDAAVDQLTVKLKHHRSNDGFAIDGAMVADIAPVPLPPAAFLLMGGLAAMGGLRRRRRAATA